MSFATRWLILLTRPRSIPQTVDQAANLILISSVGAQLLTPGASNYQTSKHAINRLCES